MLNAKKGEEYEAFRVRSGTSEKGDWELIVIKANGKAKQELTIYPEHKPSGVKEGGKFMIDDILDVQIKANKNRDGTWLGTKTYMVAAVHPTADPPSTFDFDADTYELTL